MAGITKPSVDFDKMQQSRYNTFYNKAQVALLCSPQWQLCIAAGE